MAKIEYDLVHNDEPFIIEKNQTLRLICCDCNLAHTVKFKTRKDGSIKITMNRDEEATKSLRISAARKKRSRKSN